MPLPKRRFSRSRRDKRRLNLHVKAPALNACPQCAAPVVSHRVCPSCGYYRGRRVLAVAEPKSKS